MEELIVEGLAPRDFFLLEEIIKTYPVTLESKINHETLANLYSKIKQITNYLEE